MTQELTYHEVDGIYYPDLEMPDSPGEQMKNLGKYGRMAARYLEENEPARYRMLVRFGMLGEKLQEAEAEANELYDQLTEEYFRNNPPKDRSSTMEMWGIRQQGHMMAEEVVLQQVIMKYR